MKLLDISKCHEDSPEFRSSLEKMEASVSVYTYLYVLYIARAYTCSSRGTPTSLDQHWVTFTLPYVYTCRRVCCSWSDR